MDLSFAKKGIDDSERAEAQERLLKGQPLFVEVDEIVSQDTISGLLVLSAFGAPVDTKVHVRQLRTHSHIDSLARHIQGNDYVPALRKGDIVAFDSVFIDGGDAMTARVTSRTHDGMRGRVQFAMGMARASMTSVSKRGAQQFLTIADGSQAFRVENDEDVRLAYKAVCEMPWSAGEGGFIARTPEGRTFEYHVGKDNPLQAFVEEVEAQGHLEGQGWLELIPARKFPVGREQVARDVDVRVEATKTVGKVGSQYMPEKARFPGFRPSAIVLCDEEEWAFGGRTGKVRRVAAGIQPLNRAAPLDARHLPSRVRSKPTLVTAVSGLYSDAAMDRLAAERASRRPADPAPQGSKARGNGVPDYTPGDHDNASPTAKNMPFKFGPGGKLIG
ncbi:hypothetical protein GOB57_09800 [Sinorhizobium meliloti]|nr:hypothetical protein [Sinorhizobium meliloti]